MARRKICLGEQSCTDDLPKAVEELAVCANHNAGKVVEARDVRDWTRIERILSTAAKRIRKIEKRING